MPHIACGVLCLNHASGESAASGPNTVNVFPDPDSPYANITTAEPSRRFSFTFSPHASYALSWSMNSIPFAISLSFSQYFAALCADHHAYANPNLVCVYLLLITLTSPPAGPSPVCSSLIPRSPFSTNWRHRIATWMDAMAYGTIRGQRGEGRANPGRPRAVFLVLPPACLRKFGTGERKR